MNMDVDGDERANNDCGQAGQHDLVGGPFAVIESDPGVFTDLVRGLGIRNIELVELYDIEPWAVAHLQPHGLIFCHLWRKDAPRPRAFDDPAAERVWFANQLSDDACASSALLNVMLNCPSCDIGEELRMFRAQTEEMDPVMRGLAVSNSHFIRSVHNSLARPSDIRGSINALASKTMDDLKKAAKASRSKQPPPKRRKTAPSPPPVEDGAETYHFIGYVPAYGKVWELDGLKSGPVEVGELPGPEDGAPAANVNAWMDVVRPALRMKMRKYGGAGDDGQEIRFSLLAIVGDQYEKANDEMELLRREKAVLERRLDEEFPGTPGWKELVDPALLKSAEVVFGSASGPFAVDFGSRALDRQKAILDTPVDQLASAWTECIQNTLRAKVTVEDEVTKGAAAQTEHIARTFDYEPFIEEFIAELGKAGLLNALLNRDEDGRPIPSGSARPKR
ncbi:cysteine proteinase [Auriscalpium vulgare]|uniref:Cysteine proteinase n=1 Tax=Auriscalpium vulgare TaxID=40419 RepID=A0ACB8S2R5_9AGAM|nr:cysteine proteinase [Auriscalpium vulgare]